MKIELMSQAAKLAVDCIYQAYVCGYNLKNDDFVMAENIVFNALDSKKTSMDIGLARLMVMYFRAFDRKQEYFHAMEDVVNMVLAQDCLLESMGEGEEPRLRNDLQYLVCMADLAKDEAEKRYEKAHEKAFTIAKATA